MKSNTKSSITLPRNEVRLVEELQKRLKAKSKVEVVRRGLLLLKESTDRQTLRAQYEDAAKRVRASAEEELEELDHLAGEGFP
jgi:Arc/MetJ-type ribon-helix-helix transcriptional regulator